MKIKISSGFVKTLTVAALLALPLAAFAQFNSNQVSANNAGLATDFFGCAISQGGTNGILCIIRAVLNFILSIAFIIAVVFLVLGGFRYITSQGNDDTIERAKGTITAAIIGVVVIVLAWVIITIIFNLVGTGSAGS